MSFVFVCFRFLETWYHFSLDVSKSTFAIIWNSLFHPEPQPPKGSSKKPALSHFAQHPKQPHTHTHTHTKQEHKSLTSQCQKRRNKPEPQEFFNGMRQFKRGIATPRAGDDTRGFPGGQRECSSCPGQPGTGSWCVCVCVCTYVCVL